MDNSLTSEESALCQSTKNSEKKSKWMIILKQCIYHFQWRILESHQKASTRWSVSIQQFLSVMEGFTATEITNTGWSRFIQSICLLCNTITRHATTYSRSSRKVCLQITLSDYYSGCSLMNFNGNGQRQRKTLFPTEKMKMMNLSII